MVKQQHKEDFDFSSSLTEVWRVLTDKEREMLRNNSTIQHFKRNQLIYCEGDEPKDMMCLLKGAGTVFRLSGEFRAGGLSDECFRIRTFYRLPDSDDGGKGFDLR